MKQLGAIGTLACLALAFGGGLSVAGESFARYVPEIAGTYEVSDEPGARICKFVIKSDKVKGGHLIALGKTCAKVFPKLGKAAAWVPISNEGFAFVNPQGKRIIAFELKPGDELYTITPMVDGITTIADVSWRE